MTKFNLNPVSIAFLFLLDCCNSLKITEMEVPTHKLVGDSVKLICRFHMEGDSLYSVKWYRNEQEFFRYVPNDRPKLQIFPQRGIRVERNKSNKHEVYLFDLQLDASGTYRCEVSAEAPSFRTKHEEKLMVVVQEPFENKIVGLQPSYHVGDLVNVTCFSRGSSPPAELAWKINDDKIYDERSQIDRSHYSNNYDPYKLNNQDALYNFVTPKAAEATYVFGTIRDWFEKHNTKLDTAASNLHFYVLEHHKYTGLKLECTASIGPAYWHLSQETCLVTEPAPDLTSWISSSGTSHICNFILCSFILLQILFK